MKYVIGIILLLASSITLHAEPATLIHNPVQVKAKTEIEFTYSGKLAKAGTEVRAVFFQLKGGSNKEIKTELKDDNKLVWKLNISDSVVYVLFSIKNGDEVDENGGQGFGFNVHKNGRVVPGSYAAEGLTYLIGFGIQKDVDKAVELTDKDFALNPKLRTNEIAMQWHVLALINTDSRKSEGIELAKKTFNDLMQRKTESEFAGEFAHLADPQMGTVYDSLLNVIVKHFPKGTVSYHLKSLEIQRTNDPDKILELYDTLQKDFPILSKNSEKIFSSCMVVAYRKKKDYANFEKFLAKKTDDKLFQAEQLNEVAIDLATSNTNFSAARQYSERSLAIMDSILKAGKPTDDESLEDWFQKVNTTKGNYYDTYANIYYKEGNKQLAADNEQKAVNLSLGKNTNINEQLIKYLFESNQLQAVLDCAEKFKIAQQSTVMIDSLFTVTNLALRGQEGLNAAKNRIMTQLKDAPEFKLNTLDGKSISLSSLKGKIVVLDFWATWCGPCIASFPAIQKAIEALKNNKDVCFYFINTFQRDTPEDRLEKIKNTLETKNLRFDVLLDQQIGDNFEVSDLFDIKTIPTKIIIDKRGKLYTKLVGYSEDDDEFIKELKSIVEASK